MGTQEERKKAGALLHTAELFFFVPLIHPGTSFHDLSAFLFHVLLCQICKIELGMFAKFVKVLSNVALETNIRLLQMEICSLMMAMADGRESTKEFSEKDIVNG